MIIDRVYKPNGSLEPSTKNSLARGFLNVGGADLFVRAGGTGGPKDGKLCSIASRCSIWKLMASSMPSIALPEKMRAYAPGIEVAHIAKRQARVPDSNLIFEVQVS